MAMDGIFVDGVKQYFKPEDILESDASAYTQQIAESVNAWMEENVTGGEQVTDTTLSLAGVPADSKVTGDEIDALKEDLNQTQEMEHMVLPRSESSVSMAVLGEDDVLDDLYVLIEAQQSGTGDPSPTNVRAITGFTDATIYHSGNDTSDSTSINVSWQTSAGTVYGGTLNVLTGELVVNKVMETLNGDENISYASSYTAACRFVYNLAHTAAFPSGATTYAHGMKCNWLAPSPQASFNNYYSCSIIYNNRLDIYINNSFGLTSADLLKTYLSEHPLQVVYEITPIVYHVNVTPIVMLSGINKIWSNVGNMLVWSYKKVMSCISKALSSAEYNVYVSHTLSDKSEIIYFSGSNIQAIGMPVPVNSIINFKIIHPSGATSSDTRGTGALISVTLKNGNIVNLLVNINIFPQNHNSAHKMEMVFNIYQMRYKVIGSIDYYCDDVFVKRYDVDISSENEIEKIYAIGAYFNTDTSSKTFVSYGRVGTVQAEEAIA